MSKLNLFTATNILLSSLFLSACELPNISQVKEVSASLINLDKLSGGGQPVKVSGVANYTPLPLDDILENSLANKNQGSDFVTSLKYAIETDHSINAKRRDIEAKLAAVAIANAQKDFQVGTTLYGGVEDVTDNTKGLAVALNASRLVFDGGKLDSQISSSMFEIEASKMELSAAIDQRARELCHTWLELEKYKSLQAQIDKRLSVLDPLIEQLEKVVEAGVGDVGKVTAAQRTVSAIRVEQTKVAEGLAQARLEFANSFGTLNQDIDFNYDLLSNLVPSDISDDLVQNAPLLKAQYANYQASLAKVRALKAKDGFEVGFEARAMMPFAGSEYSSDESIGLIGRKTLFNGGMLDSEIKEAESLAAARLARIKATYRTGSRSIRTAIQNIESMDKAILVAKQNAKLTSDEIVYLRQQLIIGGSTLDSVLSAEARLYEAESKEIKLLTEKYKSELDVVSTVGLLSRAIGF